MRFPLALLLLAGSPSALADGELMHCAYDDGHVASGCVVTSTVLAPAQPYGEADFAVSYAFRCGPDDPGAVLGIDLSVGPPEAPSLRPLELGKTTTVTVTSRYPVTLVDMHPNLTKNVLFDAGCSLSIGAIAISPSLDTLVAWKKEATDEAESLQDALNAYLLATDFEALLTFDAQGLAAIRTSLRDMLAARLAIGDLTLASVTDAEGHLLPAAQMPSGWDLVLATYPDIDQLFTVWSYAGDVVAGRPRTHTPAEISGAAADVKDGVAAWLKSRLRRHCDKAAAILSRAQQYGAAIDAQLQAAKDRARATLDGAPHDGRNIP